MRDQGSRRSRAGVEASPKSVALQPIVDLIDRVILGYEAQPRPADATPQQVIEGALALAQHSAPAVVFIPVPWGLLTGPSFDGVARANGLGIVPNEIAWIAKRPLGTALGRGMVRRLLALRELGFRIAVDGARSTARNRSLIARIRPDFVMLDRELPARVTQDEVARADLAALVVFLARLGGRIIARGIDGDPAAVAQLGVRYGIGAHLASPVVVNHELAELGDELVSTSWLEHREVRVIRERGSTLRVQYQPTPITAIGTIELDEASFARLLVETARTLQAEHNPERILRIAATSMFETIPSDRLVIFEADWENHRLRPRVLAGAGTEGFADGDIAMSDGITGWVFASGQPYRCSDTRLPPSGRHHSWHREDS